MSDEFIPMTKEGYEKKKADLDRMTNVEMIEVAKRIATAREMGDLSENAEYHAAREDHPLTGTVTEFDDAAGLGTITSDDGTTYAFHCTAIADGTRTIANGAATM